MFVSGSSTVPFADLAKCVTMTSPGPEGPGFSAIRVVLPQRGGWQLLVYDVLLMVFDAMIGLWLSSLVG